LLPNSVCTDNLFFDFVCFCARAGGRKEWTAMATPGFPDSRFLLGRAEQCRSLASGLRDPIFRDRMIEIAVGYEELARNADAFRPLQKIKVGELDS
jgi:hypothetical protein